MLAVMINLDPSGFNKTHRIHLLFQVCGLKTSESKCFVGKTTWFLWMPVLCQTRKALCFFFFFKEYFLIKWLF